MRNGTGKDGFAMPVAIFAIVVVGVLVTGGFFIARQESRIGVADENAQLAFYMAEKGIADFVDSVSTSTLNNMTIWDTFTFTFLIWAAEASVGDAHWLDQSSEWAVTISLVCARLSAWSSVPWSPELPPRMWPRRGSMGVS